MKNRSNCTNREIFRNVNRVNDQYAMVRYHQKLAHHHRFDGRDRAAARWPEQGQLTGTTALSAEQKGRTKERGNTWNSLRQRRGQRHRGFGRWNCAPLGSWSRRRGDQSRRARGVAVSLVTILHRRWQEHRRGHLPPTSCSASPTQSLSHLCSR